MTERSYEAVDVPQEILDRFKKLPVATVWAHTMKDAGVALPFMERVYPMTPGQRLAARARTLRFLPPRPDLLAETQLGENAPEYRAMARNSQGLAALACQSFKLTDGDEVSEHADIYEVLDQLYGGAKKGISVQRYKGLGEMNADQLWETTMDPDKRTLLQVRIEDAVAADEIFTVLMGDQVEPRRDFIVKNALEVKNLDV